MQSSRPTRWQCATVLGVALVCGCGAPPAPEAAAAPTVAPSALERYMPLPEGFVYQYDLRTDAGDTGRMMMEVSRPRPDLVELKVAGKVQRLEIGTDGIRHATGGYLLKAPLTVGAEWKGQFGVVKVVDVGRRIETPAGSFASCLATVETPLEQISKQATSVFCPDVGLVFLEVEDDEVGTVSSTLRSHGPRATGFE